MGVRRQRSTQGAPILIIIIIIAIKDKYKLKHKYKVASKDKYKYTECQEEAEVYSHDTANDSSFYIVARYKYYFQNKNMILRYSSI